MVRLLSILLLSLISQIGFAQFSKKLDSLINDYKRAPNDSANSDSPLAW